MYTNMYLINMQIIAILSSLFSSVVIDNAAKKKKKVPSAATLKSFTAV
jgi:hypothetical protein